MTKQKLIESIEQSLKSSDKVRKKELIGDSEYMYETGKIIAYTQILKMLKELE